MWNEESRKYYISQDIGSFASLRMTKKRAERPKVVFEEII